MAQKKSKSQAETSMLEVAQEIINGDTTNLEVLQEVVKSTAANMEVKELLPVEAVKAKTAGIGSTIIALILSNPELTNQQILDKVKAQFESAQTSYACIAWYKSKLRKEGKIGARVFAKKAKDEQPKAE